MSGKGPNTVTSTSSYTKPLEQAHDAAAGARNSTDAEFKKTTQVVGKPQTTDHNIADDFVKNPPKNLPGDPTGDSSNASGATGKVAQADTVEAKDPKEIQARIDGSS